LNRTNPLLLHRRQFLRFGTVVLGGVHGRTDRTASEVSADPVSPTDLTATVFHLLGVDPHAVIQDGQGRPFLLSEGAPIKELLRG
jgi:hypothetical protein